MADKNELHPSSIEFWIDQAKELKKAADYCWTLEKTVEYESAEGEFQGAARSILKDAADVDTELKWLYGNLMAFAIQYLSIGILINRDPKRFLHEVPGNRIVELAEECGVTLSQIQKAFLRQIENTFEWDRKFPHWNVSLTRNELYNLKIKHVAEKTIKIEEKKELEELFKKLRSLALDKIAGAKKVN
ncbi:MAG: hypothetical protein L0Z73_08360 [Gammaproteobacteria bacterium]|nr:hypothetical protein [Gammaproteobacteria bacterium]